VQPVANSKLPLAAPPLYSMEPLEIRLLHCHVMLTLQYGPKLSCDQNPFFFNRDIVLRLPIAVQEIVLVAWLIVKGFDLSAIALMTAKAQGNKT